MTVVVTIYDDAYWIVVIIWHIYFHFFLTLSPLFFILLSPPQSPILPLKTIPNPNYHPTPTLYFRLAPPTLSLKCAPSSDNYKYGEWLQSTIYGLAASALSLIATAARSASKILTLATSSSPTLFIVAISTPPSNRSSTPSVISFSRLRTTTTSTRSSGYDSMKGTRCLISVEV